MLSLDDLSQLEASKGRLIVAFSGGCDSHVLLHYLQQNLSHPVEALHVNHGLSENASNWQRHCEQVCDELSVPLSSFAVQVDRSGSIEANARSARYQVFELVLQAGDILLMGHHQDDQIETVLLNMLSGRAMFGIQGMPAKRALGRGQLVRPMLDLSRLELRDYAEDQGLCWIEDESNQDTQHDRNYLRVKVLPVLKDRWPDLTKTISDQWQKTASYLEHLEHEAQRDFEALKVSSDCIDFHGFAALPKERAVALLRYWLRLAGGDRSPGSSTLENALMVLKSEKTESPIFVVAGCRIQRFRSRLVVLISSVDEVGKVSDVVTLQDEQGRFGMGILSANIAKGRGVSLPFRQLSFRRRSGGEKLRVKGHHRSLKNLFQESGCPPLVRDQLPLVFDGGELVGIAGIDRWGIPMVVRDDYRPLDGAAGTEINWSPLQDNRYSD